MNFLRVKNWESFQHYKDRSPPWVKLHRDLLRDYSFSCLQDASKAHLMLIWLLASQLDNKIPHDPEWIRKQIGSSEPVNLKPLIDAGFLIPEQDATKTLAPCKQSAMLETEAETEKEKPIGRSAKPPDRAAALLAELKPLYPKRNGANPWPKAEQALRARLREGVDPDTIRAGLERYAAWCAATGKIGTETVMQAVRFFGKGREWEADWSPPADAAPLPTDRNELWKLRSDLGLPYEFSDLKTCHAEIRAAMRGAA